jgi:hypothetical protein
MYLFSWSLSGATRRGIVLHMHYSMPPFISEKEEETLSNFLHMQEEAENLRILWSLHLSGEQGAVLGDTWQRWVKDRQALGERFLSAQTSLAVHALAAVPHPLDISTSFTSRSSATSEGVHP